MRELSSTASFWQQVDMKDRFVAFHWRLVRHQVYLVQLENPMKCPAPAQVRVKSQKKDSFRLSHNFEYALMKHDLYQQAAVV